MNRPIADPQETGPMRDAEVKINGVYEHYKGKKYKVLQVVRHSETLEQLVMYETLYECELGNYWVRPLEMFLGNLEYNGETVQRFRLLDQ